MHTPMERKYAGWHLMLEKRHPMSMAVDSRATWSIIKFGGGRSFEDRDFRG